MLVFGVFVNYYLAHFQKTTGCTPHISNIVWLRRPQVDSAHCTFAKKSAGNTPLNKTYSQKE